MNYYQPREIIGEDGKGTGKWRYTVRNDDRIWAVGYCSPHNACPDCDFPADPDCGICSGRGLVDVENPCPGHDTPNEAREHMRQYLVDTGIRLNHGRLQNQQVRCDVEGCDEWTQDCAAVIGLGLPIDWNLCEKHMTEETVASLITVGDVISS